MRARSGPELGVKPEKVLKISDKYQLEKGDYKNLLPFREEDLWRMRRFPYGM